MSRHISSCRTGCVKYIVRIFLILSRDFYWYVLSKSCLQQLIRSTNVFSIVLSFNIINQRTGIFFMWSSEFHVNSGWIIEQQTTPIRSDCIHFFNTDHYQKCSFTRSARCTKSQQLVKRIRNNKKEKTSI